MVCCKSFKRERRTEGDTFNEQAAVPIVPEKGWRSFPSQDIPSLFNYEHIYHYALESIQTVQLDPPLPPPPKVVEADDQDEIDGLGHMTDKPLNNGRKYVDSKFVHDLMDNKTDQHYFLR